MRIIHVYDGHERVFPGEGSTPSVVYYVAKYTAKKGYDVTVLERKWKDLPYEEEIEGIKFIRYDVNVCSNISNKELPHDAIKNPFKLSKFILDRFIFALKVNKYLKENNIDIIHVHVPFAANFLIHLNKSLRNKMVYTAHIGQEEIRLPNLVKDKNVKPPILLRILLPDWHLMKRIAKITVMHEGLAKKLVQCGFREADVHVIPHGIDLADFDNIDSSKIKNVREKFISNDKLNVLFATTVTPHKGVEYLVRAANILINKHRLDVRFILAGETNIDEEFVEKIKNYIERNGLTENVIFTGFLPYEDLKALYLLSDIFVYPLLGYGGVAICLLEAMTASLPIIATNIGGLYMQVKDGWNGFLVEPRNEKQLADKIRYLVENDEIRKEMGENSRKLVEEEFSWEKIAEKYVKVYKKLI